MKWRQSLLLKVIFVMAGLVPHKAGHDDFALKRRARSALFA
jgi:hypothetical protein